MRRLASRTEKISALKRRRASPSSLARISAIHLRPAQNEQSQFSPERQPGGRKGKACFREAFSAGIGIVGQLLIELITPLHGCEHYDPALRNRLETEMPSERRRKIGQSRKINADSTAVYRRTVLDADWRRFVRAIGILTSRSSIPPVLCWPNPNGQAIFGNRR